jgi:hypothetical protein
MPDLHPLEDEAAPYVLGTLTPAERRAFEEHLAQSPQLRALVRELEEGAVALSLAALQRKAPPQGWAGIEKAIARETKRPPAIPVFWFTGWQAGWAAAVVCLTGWLLTCVLWTSQPGRKNAPPSMAAEVQTPAPAVRPSPATNLGETTPAAANAAEALQSSLQAKTREAVALRQQVAELQSRVVVLRQTLTQAQALLSEPNRLKFMQLLPAAGGGQSAIATLSPALQRAMFLALGRELGWLPPAGDASDGDGSAPVDYVDLRPGAGTETNPGLTPPETSALNSQTPDSAALTNASAAAIPAFMSGTNMIVALDSTFAPAGSQVTFSTGSDSPLGTAIMGTNALVVTIPLSGAGGSGQILTISSVTSGGNSAGSSNALQFFIPATSVP